MLYGNGWLKDEDYAKTICKEVVFINRIWKPILYCFIKYDGFKWTFVPDKPRWHGVDRAGLLGG